MWISGTADSTRRQTNPARGHCRFANILKKSQRRHFPRKIYKKMRTEKNHTPLSFALFGNSYQPKKSVALDKLLDCFRRHGCDYYIDKSYYDFLTESMGRHIEPKGVFEGNEFDVDYAISLGGDGTLLHVAARVGSKGTPIIGVNMGRLGYLADFQPSELDDAMDALIAGRCRVENHSVIRVETDGEKIDGYAYALNDVAVLKRDNASMIGVRITVNGEVAGTLPGDGLIVATPTGSTAYSLSNGGPIIGPNTGTFCLTPVAPHSLTARPIVVKDDCRIELTVDSRSHNYLVALDGRSQKMPDTTSIIITRADFCVKIVKRPGVNYFDTLREKMMWGVDQRN